MSKASRALRAGVTPRVGAVDELQRRADMLVTAMELEGMAVWAWDRREDLVRIEFRASAAGFMRADAPSMSGYMDRIHSADRQMVQSTMGTALDVPGIHRVEFRFFAPDGSERWIGSTMQRYLRPDGEPGGLIGASRDITRRKETFQALAETDQRLRELAREIIGAASREQERIGRDLHDGLGQELTGIALMLKALQGRAGSGQEGLQRDLGEILRLVNHALGSTRAIARGLSPVAVEQGGLVEALRALVTRVREGSKLRFRLSLRLPPEREPPQAIALHLYRISQEALSNAIRHSGASHISVSLDARDGQLRLRIADDGVGLDGPGEGQDGLGLRIMQYRAQLIGATFEAGQASGGGTTIVVTWQPDPAREVAG